VVVDSNRVLTNMGLGFRNRPSSKELIRYNPPFFHSVSTSPPETATLPREKAPEEASDLSHNAFPTEDLSEKSEVGIRASAVALVSKGG